MEELDELYTVGLWTAKPGKEDDFIRAWEEFARWTSAHQPGAAEAHLLQDIAHPQRFFSFGPWENSRRIDDWRATPEFRAFVVQVRELCEDFQPGTFKPVARIAP
jgi:quinol monooxygenase YgiN